MPARTGDLNQLERNLGDRVRRDHPFGALTTYRVGGTASLYLEAGDEDDLVAAARGLDGLEVPVVVLGRGSNLLVADAGFDGLVISLGAGFESLSIDGHRVRAGAALSLPVLARRTVAAGLHGLEWAVGVPGSVGGAIRMNAGGHGSDTASTLVGLRWVDLRTATAHETPAAWLAPSYRHTELAPTDVVVAAIHELVDGDLEDGAATLAEIVRWRRAHQPGGSNAGSVFTNPPDDSAGRLVEACGLKGLRLGSAEVSTKHANFIQADPGGSADDVLALIDQVRTVVAATTGIEMRTEVRLVGFGPCGGDSR